MIFIFACLHTYAQGSTSKGTEFWTAYMANSNPPTSNSPSVMDLYITSDVNTSGTVTFGNGSPSINFTVTATQVTILTMPTATYIVNQGTSHYGIHITSLKPVAIYAHIFANSSSGATLLLPVNTLGKDYYSINYTQMADETAYSAFMVIATEDSTMVEITPTASLLDGSAANTAFSVTLNKGDVYQGLSNDDLTGTRIQSVSSGLNTCKKIAVFAGSTRVQIGCNEKDNSSDNLFQQVYPTASWGKNYITVPLSNRDYDVFRVILSTPNTNVTINGQLISPSQFTNGFYYTFNSSVPNIITSDQPIQVAQYAVSQGNTPGCGNLPDDVGDPEMIFLTPLEQTLDHVTLFSASNYKILNSYINVLIKANAVASFKLDGASYNGFNPVPNDGTYAYAQIPVVNGPHTISAGDGFNAIAYGFGLHESYGYAAGANLQNLNEFIALENPQTGGMQSNGCSAVNYNLQLTLPYKTTNIQWNFENGTTPYTDSKPVIADSLVQNNQTVYIYKYPKSPVAYTSGSYSVVATVFNPKADICGSTENIELDFLVTDPPVAKFAVSLACLGDSTQFTDGTTGVSTLKSWLWNFGDNQTSTLQNPAHKYLNPGNYNVSLTVMDVDSCTSVYDVPALHIDAKPVALFAASTPDCLNQTITFTDKSTTTDGTLAKWIWDFGDGVKDTVTAKNTLINHTYATTGTDTVKLTVFNSDGCSGNVFVQLVVIHPLPVVNFAMPDVCLAQGSATFADQSAIADSTASGFTYLWNFGDSNANAANPNTSTLQNPTHTYTAAAYYNVTLTVTSKYGCSVSKTQQFTVNGSNPVAAFSVENNNDLCSSNDVIFDDKSSVGFGNITRIVWYFDYNNNPADTAVYTLSTMPADKKYHHLYTLSNSVNPQNYDVRMVVYSGSSQSCANQVDTTITVNGNPLVAVSNIGNICQGANPVQIQVNTGVYTGKGVFSGAGVSATGLFTPGVTGLGTHTINYLFTATNGCTYSTSQQINVEETPVITVDSVFTMLQGGQINFNATVLGEGLTYKWSPSTGLSNPDILNPVATPANDTQYMLTVTAADSCSAIAHVTVNVLLNIVIPNAFTPNGDGINDFWEIQHLDSYPNCIVQIFNRYGEKLFYSVGYQNPWDGKYKGSNLPAGTYYYIIDPKSGRKPVSGFIAIIR
ncbi:MAG: PKD domain-containing protein [Sphingobacteriales bacterium]